ncbi:MAG: serine hydrolase domain-containing protein [Pseudomonadota bacterium]
MSAYTISGFVAPEFEPVREVFEQNFEEGVELGAGFSALIDGEIVVDLQGGWSDKARSAPWDARTLVPVFSTTKAIAALVIAMLVDRGLIDYDAPLANYWPEFGAEGKDKVTVAEALSHQGGVAGFLEPIDPALWLDPPALAEKLAALKPMWPLGEGAGYHPLSWGYIAGELVQRVAGRSLGTILREEVCAPLDIDFWIGTPASEHDRCADLKRPSALADLGEITEIKRAAFLQKWSAPNRGGAIWRETEIPSANGHGTALSVAQLYGAYAHKGRLFGKSLFSEETWQALTKSRVYGPNKVLPFTLSFGAGPMRNSERAFGPNPDTLGHSGWGGSAAFGDPDRGLSAAYVMNQQSNILLGDPRSKRLFEALYGCL